MKTVHENKALRDPQVEVVWCIALLEDGGAVCQIERVPAQTVTLPASRLAGQHISRGSRLVIRVIAGHVVDISQR